MTSVKSVVAADELHALLLMGLLLREVRHTFGAEEWNGLRQSHFRVITAVPPDGVSITDLADRVGMTKQGCGQFVTQLAASGHLQVLRDPLDGRGRIVRRTSLGTTTIRRVTARILEIEDGWARRVGEARYATFRRVLEEIALGRPTPVDGDRHTS